MRPQVGIGAAGAEEVVSRREYEDRILRVAARIRERREARAFAEAFVRAPAWLQDEIREEFNRPSLILGMLAERRGHSEDTQTEDSA